MPKSPSEENGGPTTSFSPWGAKSGPKIANSTITSVRVPPKTKRFCFNAFWKVLSSFGAGEEVGVAGSAGALIFRGPRSKRSEASIRMGCS